MTDQDREVELLKFNYRNLHESIWEAHKVAWTVTGMFIPFTLALQGYIGKRYIDNDNPPAILFVAGAIVAELLIVIWRLIMRTLEHYNGVRIGRLREIEESLNNREMSEAIVPNAATGTRAVVLQYAKKLDYTPKVAGFSMSTKRIYNSIVLLITTINICLSSCQLEHWISIVILIIWAFAVVAGSLVSGRLREKKKRSTRARGG
jgi:general stress protein CsbA